MSMHENENDIFLYKDETDIFMQKNVFSVHENENDIFMHENQNFDSGFWQVFFASESLMGNWAVH